MFAEGLRSVAVNAYQVSQTQLLGATVSVELLFDHCDERQKR